MFAGIAHEDFTVKYKVTKLWVAVKVLAAWKILSKQIKLVPLDTANWKYNSGRQRPNFRTYTR